MSDVSSNTVLALLCLLLEVGKLLLQEPEADLGPTQLQSELSLPGSALHRASNISLAPKVQLLCLLRQQRVGKALRSGPVRWAHPFPGWNFNAKSLTDFWAWQVPLFFQHPRTPSLLTKHQFLPNWKKERKLTSLPQQLHPSLQGLCMSLGLKSVPGR